MMRALIALAVMAAVTSAAPIPKILKATPDSDNPEVKLMQGNCPCRFERDGNRMVWVYTTDAKAILDNCEAGPNRYQYVFELVK